MNPPAAQTKNELLKERQAAAEEKRREANAKATEITAKKDYSHETWIDANTVKFEKIEPEGLPKNLDGISIAKSKFPMGKNDEEVLLKELKQAVILRDKGASVYLLPKAKDAQGRNIPGPDAIVNGKIFEFKTVTGSLGKLEQRFRDSRKQGGNTYIRVLNEHITRQDVVQQVIKILKDKTYTGGFKGSLVFTVGKELQEKTYFVNIKDLKPVKNSAARG